MPISGPRPTAVLGPPLRSIELIVPSKPLSLSLRAPRGGVARHGVVLTDLQFPYYFTVNKTSLSSPLVG